ncbi:MAG: ABC transporter ATP-binding protein [Myxococcota bacterium]|nr:ABC transporter ATP-binding protein [Myxococcota bacterium]
MVLGDTAPAIRVANLAFCKGEKTILKDVSFAVKRGEYLHIIGPNGAGKTTLLKCLMRIHRGPMNALQIFGAPLESLSQRSLAKVIGYVPQSSQGAFGFTAYEFVAMGRYPYLSPFSGLSAHDQSKVEEALALTKTDALATQPMDTLSGGERQRIFIAAALAQGAEILLLDEPTTYLDPRHQAHIEALLNDLQHTLGLTLIAVTHDINSAALWGDRILALKQGRVVFSGIAAELMHNDILQVIYDKQFVFVDHPTAGSRIVVPDRSPE